MRNSSGVEPIERYAVRVVIFDSDGSVLLLSTRDASNASFRESWEIPGGGIRPGETPIDGAVREIREETGLHLQLAQLKGPLWRRDVIYTYRGERRLQHEAIYTAVTHGQAPEIDRAGRESFELEDHMMHRWWSVDDIRATKALFYPRSLPLYIADLAAGRRVSEALEVWDDTD